MDKQSYWVYMLLCSNNTYYTGYTNDLERRYQAHLDGTSKCKYTRSFKPVCIAQSWKIEGNKAQAMHCERFIKKLSRKDKEAIIAQPELLMDTADKPRYVEPSLKFQHECGGKTSE